MVSTRHHPRPFPGPASPTTRSTSTTPSKGSPRLPSPSSSAGDAVAVAKPSATRSTRKRKSTTTPSQAYTHVVDRAIVLWMYISLPLVFWDSGYILLRPWSMPGGWLHSPIWAPYNLYGTVDYIYGWPAWNDGVGFTAAQGSLNVLESVMYLYYVAHLALRGKETGWYKFWEQSFWTETTVVSGEGLALATVVCFASAIMTVSKTVLYWLNEYFSGFENIGHNPPLRLFFLWIIPNGAWLVLPSYMIYVLGKEIVSAMQLAGKSGLEKEE